MRISLLAFFCAMIASNTLANVGQFSGDDIRKNIIGRRIYLAVPLGGEFPLNYHASGKVDGSGEALGLGRYAKPKDSGKWWIDADRLCQQFNTWYDGKPMCFDLYPVDAENIKWVRDDGSKGTARIGTDGL